MKRTALKKVSKVPIVKLQKKIWDLCREITRKRYPKICYTCDKPLQSSRDMHTGHMWAKAALGAYLKYDLRILRIQCFTCNIWGGGRGADFYARMLKEIGPAAMRKLEKDRQITVKAYDHYLKVLKDYQELIKTL